MMAGFVNMFNGKNLNGFCHLILIYQLPCILKIGNPFSDLATVKANLSTKNLAILSNFKYCRLTLVAFKKRVYTRGSTKFMFCILVLNLQKTSVKSGLLNCNSVLGIVLVSIVKIFLKPMFRLIYQLVSLSSKTREMLF